jgi:DNA-binding transcriptional regulator YiaG
MPIVNVAKIREKTGLSQRAFAEHYGLRLRTVQTWELRGNVGDVAYALLKMIDHDIDASRAPAPPPPEAAPATASH